jgi:hypothetical protein
MIFAVALGAFAYWTTGGAGNASASVGTLSAPASATAANTPGSGTVSVSWSAVTAPDGGAVTGYYVQRYVGSTPSAACGTTSSSLTTSTSCADTSVPDGTFTYKVTAVFRSWTAQSAASNSVTVVNDTTPPTVSSINRNDPTPTNASTVHWAVTFSENVTGVDATDLALVGAGASGASITSVSGSGASYSVAVSTGANGSLGLNLVDNDSIVDGVGNKLGGTGTSGAGDGSFTGQAYVVDKTAPTVSSITRASTSPTNAGPLTWTVTFSEPVSNVTTSNFGLVTSNLGGTAPSISSVTPSGSAPTVIWTVSVSTTSTTGTNAGSIGLNLTSIGSIADAATNALSATLPVVGQAYTYDTTAPTAADIQAANGGGIAGRIGSGDVITYSFSEAMSPTSILTGWSGASTSVSIAVTNSSSNDTLTVTGVNLGTIATGGNYVGASSTVTATMVMGGSTITLTLTSSPSSPNTVLTSTMVWTPSASARDLAGNAISTTPRTESGAPKLNF